MFLLAALLSKLERLVRSLWLPSTTETPGPLVVLLLVCNPLEGLISASKRAAVLWLPFETCSCVTHTFAVDGTIPKILGAQQ